MEESKFAGWDLRLVDEELAAGVLTKRAGSRGNSAGGRRQFREGAFHFFHGLI